MSFPDFFAAAPRITVRDPLAQFLGAADGGVFEYRYEDAVKLAGHSCPTLFFHADIEDQVRFTRVDTGAAVSVSARLERVPGDPRMGPLIQRAARGEASPEDETLFQSLWQARVRALLLEHADDPQTIVVH